jgi:hypothetical protein
VKHFRLILWGTFLLLALLRILWVMGVNNGWW